MFSPATGQAIRDIVAREFGAGVRMVVNVVDALAQTARGKYRFSICNLDKARR